MSRDAISVHSTTESFICCHCGWTVVPPVSGSEHRNHCPHCLHSVHLDLRPGDRRSGCRGAMEPIAVWARSKGEWSILHRCSRCGLIRANRIAADDAEAALIALAARPLSTLPFPLETLTAGPRGVSHVR